MSIKKGLNEIAALEKLFSDDYGEESIKNFNSGWDQKKEKQYLYHLKKANAKKNDKEYSKVEVDGILISERAILRKTDRSCPVCKTYSFSGKDDLYMNRFKCCYECYIDFVDDREERWEQGWRPDNKRLEAALQRRKKQWPI